ncbi:hypothetical protein AX14_013655 [Amanita brunnescens Koide BX004]|nr:hypothetical protein AX14_013655 [Amanita brunnescens Koide BX004]
MFARQQLIEEIARKGYNVLLYESWRAVVHRRGKEHRVEVRYSGRPARISGAVQRHHDSYPPCLGVLQSSV